jgi:hypothetical protein
MAVPAAQAHWLAVCRARQVAGATPESMAPAADTRAVHGATPSAQPASSPSKAAVTGPEVMTGAQCEVPLPGQAVKWVASRSRPAIR